jgi:hypothetical protein
MPSTFQAKRAEDMEKKRAHEPKSIQFALNQALRRAKRQPRKNQFSAKQKDLRNRSQAAGTQRPAT